MCTVITKNRHCSECPFFKDVYIEGWTKECMARTERDGEGCPIERREDAETN